MKRKMLIPLIIIIVIIAVPIIFLRTAPQLGHKSLGESLEKIKKSPNYKSGIFLNPVRTLMDMPSKKVFKEMAKKAENRIPQDKIETKPLNIEAYKTKNSNEAIITWLGHSTMLIKIDGITILTDPVFSKRASIISLFGPKKFLYTNEYSVSDLPPVDIVLISHDHYDHLDYKTIKELKNVSEFYVPLGTKAHLVHWGIKEDKIKELDWWEEINYGDIKFAATPARHFSGRQLNDRFKTLWCGWVIKGKSHSLFFSGDSGYFDGFKQIGEKYGPFDFSMMENGQYSIYWPEIHMMPEESVTAAIDLKSKAAMPIHWGKFKLSIHEWNEPPRRFYVHAKKNNLKVVLPFIGQTFNLNSLPVDTFTFSNN